MSFNRSVVVGNYFQSLLDFSCKLGAECDIFVNEGELAVFMLPFEDKKGVVFE
jgi:hypothetical protein